MKKFFAVILACACALGLFVGASPLPIRASAETVTGAKLEYFELNQPVCVAKDGEFIYIAEKELIVIYHDDTYNKIPMQGFSIESIAKCGNHLLVLSLGGLYSLNLATLEVALLSSPQPDVVNFTDISSFAVSGNYFAVITNSRQVCLFNVTDEENFLFQLHSNGDLTVDSSSQLALTPDLILFYYSELQGNIYMLDLNSGMQGPYKKAQPNGVDCFAYNDSFYYKTDDVIYSLGNNLLNDLPETVVDLSALGITDSGDFFIKDNLILVCDTKNDRVLEYDVTQGKLTGFEVSFTKIDLPDEFKISHNATPNFVQIPKGVILYDIDLVGSQEKGYFVFNGYHNQSEAQEYLVVDEISNAYYLIAGEVVALVLKEDFTPAPIVLNDVNGVGYFTSTANIYLQPRLTKEFVSYQIEKHSAVNVVCNFSLSGINYSLVKQGEKVGFIPSSFIVESLQTLPDYYAYRTANLTNKACEVYEDSACTTVIDTLPAYAQVIISEELDGVYQVVYGNTVGYIKKSSIQKRGFFTNKIALVIILLAVALLVSAIHLEIKYLYTKKKDILPTKKVEKKQ